jgi:membrane protease subunit HflK
MVVVLAALALGIGTALSGWVVVAPGEAAVVRRLGRVWPRPWGPGLHLGLPAGFDQVTRVRSAEVRRITIGRAAVASAADEPGAGEFLTGDLNLLRAEATVQYRVADPVAYVLRAREVEPLLQRLAEAGLSRALARQGIDATLRDGRAAAAQETARALERGVGQYGLGVEVLGVSLTDARPPSEVAADFAAAQAARSEHDRRVNDARAYATKSATESQARAGARIEQAHARADRTRIMARSRAARFRALLAEVSKSRPLAMRRLYLEALTALWPRIGRKLVLTPDEPVDLSLIGGGR